MQAGEPKRTADVAGFLHQLQENSLVTLEIKSCTVDIRNQVRQISHHLFMGNVTYKQRSA